MDAVHLVLMELVESSARSDSSVPVVVKTIMTRRWRVRVGRGLQWVADVGWGALLTYVALTALREMGVLR